MTDDKHTAAAREHEATARVLAQELLVIHEHGMAYHERVAERLTKALTRAYERGRREEREGCERVAAECERIARQSAVVARESRDHAQVDFDMGSAATAETIAAQIRARGEKT